MKNNPSEGKTDKRKIFIVEGLEQDEKLHKHFAERNPDWDVSFILGSLTKLKEKIASIAPNEFSYFDIIVLCDEEGNHITNESLKTILARIEKELLPKFPPSIITFLIIVDGNDDNGYVFHSDTKPVSFGDAQIPKPVFRIVKKNIFEDYIEAFFRHDEMFNIFIAKKFDLENNFMKNNPSEGKTDKRKIFIVEGLEQDEKLHKHFAERNPDWDVSFILGSLTKLKEKIASIAPNEFSYFDIIVLCDEEGNHITNESLKTILARLEKELLPKFPPSIITFLIIVDGNDDSGYVFHSDTKPVSFGDVQIPKPVFRIVKKNIFDDYIEAFFRHDEMFNIFIAKKFDLESNFMKNNPSEGKTDKRKIFIVEGLEQDEKLHKHFAERNPDWDVSFILGSLTKLKEKIASIAPNEFSYFDIIVLCDEEGNHITNESLKTILARIEKELLPKFPPSIITFLIIVDGNDDNGYVFHSDTKPVSFGDAQIPKPVFRIVKKNIFEDYTEAFFRHDEMFNIFIAKKFDLESNFMKNNPSEGKTDKRKIFIVEGLEQDEKLHKHFAERNPDWHVSFILGSLTKLKEKIASIALNEFSYFDIIVLCDDEGNHITNESLKTILARLEKELLPKFPPSIITFLIIVDGNDDNGYAFHSDTKPVSFGDAQIPKPVFRIVKKNIFEDYIEAFFRHDEMFNIFIAKKFDLENNFLKNNPSEGKTDKRKIFIVEGLEQDEKLHKHFAERNPDWDVSFILGSLTKLKEKIASIAPNEFSYFDIIVLCDEEGNHITNESLKTILARIEKELLPKFPPSIITFLIIIDGNDDNGYVFHSDTKPVSFGDAQIPKPVFRIVKKNIFEDYTETFFRHDEMFNIFIAKKFDLESNFLKNNPSEGKTDKRKIFIVEGLEQNEILHEHFSRDIPDWDVSFILNQKSLMEQIASIPINEFSFFDIIVVCDEDSNEITNESLRTMLSNYPTSIITFLITVNEMDDNKTESQPEINNDTEAVIALLKREFFPEFWDSFIKSLEMFNVFIRKADTRKHLRLQVHGREKLS
ncbi:uncharacterized protein LOC118768007 [Octopus sinensis]|uniref:Uncharacterized protein LOC118768007 n=1 Tax=Octopus sinensis TaxID=2607531 RepID=A0A7E6FRS0_9MOLL|nr:uncharacterized protein LOC118768007 [Octopus sinensis]